MNTPGKENLDRLEEERERATIRGRAFNAAILTGAGFLVGSGVSLNTQPTSPWTLHLRGGLFAGVTTLSLFTGVQIFYQDNGADGAAMALTSGSLLGFAKGVNARMMNHSALVKRSAGSGLSFLGLYGLGWATRKMYTSSRTTLEDGESMSEWRAS